MRDVWMDLVILEGKFPLVVLSLWATYQLSLSDGSRGRARGPSPPPLFLDQTKNFFGDRTLPPPYLRVWMTGPLLISRSGYGTVTNLFFFFLTKHLFPCCGLLCM